MQLQGGVKSSKGESKIYEVKKKNCGKGTDQCYMKGSFPDFLFLTKGSKKYHLQFKNYIMLINMFTAVPLVYDLVAAFLLSIHTIV